MPRIPYRLDAYLGWRLAGGGCGEDWRRAAATSNLRRASEQMAGGMARAAREPGCSLLPLLPCIRVAPARRHALIDLVARGTVTCGFADQSSATTPKIVKNYKSLSLFCGR
ncbi:hypothetical protein MTO96_042953 [Rhipicephalus appendiculatus]